MSDKWLVYNCLSLVVLYYLAHCLLEQLTAEYNYSCSEYSDDSHSEMYQPRGSLARTLYNKQLIDATLETMDQSQWYAVDSHRLHDNIRQVFVPMRADQETHAFLENASHKSDAIFTQIWHSIVKTLLKWFMTQTDINGLLGRGSMFVFSSSQLSRLLERRLGQQGDLLDLGAGDGLITQNLANFFSHVYVTETSRTMRWALMKRGFTLLHLDKWSEKRYDVISCLNLLDRCDQPLSILHQMKHSLKPGGKAIIAVVLPFQPYVEKGRSDHQPTEWLPIKGNTFEDQVNSVVTQVLEPAGFIVELFTRLPYLCEGDLQQAYYWLDDAVFVEDERYSLFQQDWVSCRTAKSTGIMASYASQSFIDGLFSLELHKITCIPK